MTPGDLATGLNSQGRKDLERSSQDLRVSRRVGTHALRRRRITLTTAATRSTSRPRTHSIGLFLPYLSFESDLGWSGAQIKDVWRWSHANSLVIGFDYERVTSVSRSAHANGRSRGAVLGRWQQAHRRSLRREYAELWGGARSLLSADASITSPPRPSRRRSRRTSRHRKATSASSIRAFGIKHEVLKNLRAHSAVGRGFIPAEALMLTGVYDDHRRRAHADQPGQSRSEAGAQHVLRRRRGVDLPPHSRSTSRPSEPSSRIGSSRTWRSAARRRRIRSCCRSPTVWTRISAGSSSRPITA